MSVTLDAGGIPSPAERRLRDRLAAHLGVSPERREQLYIELSRSAAIKDLAYWLQILFSCGIATIGLILSSPAVIIGAMLISPLMGPILAAGLSLTVGDLVLGVRSAVKLALSCAVAIGFAMFLVWLLPFKEMTQEIAARTRPNTLDLVVALFSGAVGSVATCKDVKGVATSIPGVAIAVALMPPLCVVGYGLGVWYSTGAVADGMGVARGGGLLFLTNLVAIIFTAMLVFLGLRVGAGNTRERVGDWLREDNETAWFRALLNRLPFSTNSKAIGSLPARILIILIPVLVILVPLTQAFVQLKQELRRQQQENRTRSAATELWQQRFGKFPDGQPRSYIDQVTVIEQGAQLVVSFRVFTIQPSQPTERDEFTRLLAARFARSPDAIGFQLVEVPTASMAVAEKIKEEEPVKLPPTVAQMQADFLRAVDAAVNNLRLPPGARLLDYAVTTGRAEPMRVRLIYLAEKEISPDAQALIVEDLKNRLNYPSAVITLEDVSAVPVTVRFKRNRAEVGEDFKEPLERAGDALRQHPSLRLEVAAVEQEGERDGVAEERARALADYITSVWGVAQERIGIVTGKGADGSATLKVSMR